MTEIKNMSNRHNDEVKFSKHFLIFIKSTANNSHVVCRAPEDLSLQLTSDWDNAIDGGSVASVIELGAQEALGRSTKSQFASAQIWAGTSPINITISLEFHAEENPRQEVLNPIIELTKMALPRQSGSGGSKGLFVPPGPRIFNKDGTSNDNISITLGNFLQFRKVIITDVSPVFSTRDMGKDGIPLRAKCDVTFRTSFSLTGADFENMFIVR